MDTAIEVGDGITLFARILGNGDPVIVPLACWCEEFDVLAERRKVILYDPRGRGRSSPVAIPQVSFENDLADLEAVRAALELDRVSLVGWSYFGGVVARYAMLHPQRVTRLVTVGGTPIRGGEFMQSVQAGQLRRLIEVAGPLMADLRNGVPFTPPRMQQYWDAFVDTRTAVKPPWPAMRSRPFEHPNETPGRVFPVVTRAMQTLGDWDWRADAPRIEAPTLVIDGAADIMPEQATEEWVAAIPNARAAVMEGVGHFPIYEAPERFFAILDDFLPPGSDTLRT